MQTLGHCAANESAGRHQSLEGSLRFSFVSLDVDEVQIAGNWAFERGRYRIALHPRAGGGAIEDIGKYITVYQRKPGDSWRMARDIWNSSNPPPGM